MRTPLHLFILPYVFSLFVFTSPLLLFFFFFNDTAPTEIYTLSLHDALPISAVDSSGPVPTGTASTSASVASTEIGRAPSELQSRVDLVCRLLLEKKKKK